MLTPTVAIWSVEHQVPNNVVGVQFQLFVGMARTTRIDKYLKVRIPLKYRAIAVGEFGNDLAVGFDEGRNVEVVVVPAHFDPSGA